MALSVVGCGLVNWKRVIKGLEIRQDPGNAVSNCLELRSQRVDGLLTGLSLVWTPWMSRRRWHCEEVGCRRRNPREVF